LPELSAELQQFIKETGALFRLDNFIFPDVSPEAPISHEQIAKDFKKALEQIGIDETKRKERHIVFHSWRHYCAKNLAQVANRNIGMTILGHKTSIMFDHYADHVDKETFAKMTEAIEQGLKPGIGKKKPATVLSLPMRTTPKIPSDPGWTHWAPTCPESIT
jgi:integrase